MDGYAVVVDAAGGAASGEDKDLVLARMIQEQENAFMLFQQGGTSSGYSEPLSAEQESVDGAEVDEDERLARQLQAEEQQELYQRMRAMAGLSNEEVEAFEHDDSTDPGAMSYEDLSALGDIAGTVSRGLAPAAVERLPRRTFSDIKAESRGACSHDMCAICRMDFQDDEECRVLPACKHCYHADCVEQWLNVNKVCPMCATEVKA